ncbi:tetratricopeptide repeat protein, partial [Erythrobacter sp.]|uniref:tetratricopeptide repeat protein n=1 Tax=Erythrobacter sp. TaxID=1042 RepID=UPI003C73C959
LDDQVATNTNLSAMTGGASNTAAASSGNSAQAAEAGPSPERLAAVQQITKPQTGDAGDDEYTYGFRLWDAGFYPEARQQLASYVEEYPDHFRVTYGRNLLGRAFLDDGMPEEAARWFLRNYQEDRTGRRAPDSLLYLAEAMIAMNDTGRACIALAEFGETYPAVATGRLSDQYEANRRRVTCE